MKKTCSFLNCDRAMRARGYCSAHYHQLRFGSGLVELGSVGRRPLVKWESRTCKFAVCDRPATTRGWCTGHYAQERRGGPMAPLPVRVKRVDGWAVNKQGYVVRSKPRGDGTYKKEQQHRTVMEKKIGRPLIRTENVHHKNGIRHDNRLENLELWSTWQPPGQRVNDKIAWAKELLAFYETTSLVTINKAA